MWDTVWDNIEAILATVTFVAGVLALIYRKAIRPFVGWVRDVHKIVTRELNHNGGSSMKDHATALTSRMATIEDQVTDLRQDFSEYREDDIAARARTWEAFGLHLSDGHGGPYPPEVDA